MKKDIQAIIDQARANIIRPVRMGNTGDASEIVVEMYMHKAFTEMKDMDNSQLQKLKTDVEANLLDLVPLKMDSVFIIMYMKCQLFAIDMLLKDDGQD